VTLAQVQSKLKLVMAELASCHRKGQWCRAKVLSQERCRLRRQLTRHHPCPDCGVPLSKNATRCLKCSIVHRYWKRRLTDTKP
jgi:hypothetical protein